MTIAAPRGIHLVSVRTNGAAITAVVNAAPSNAKTCDARSMTITPMSVASTNNPKKAKPLVDTTTEYSRRRRGRISLSEEEVTRSALPKPVHVQTTSSHLPKSCACR
jgi:hypothetical protein